MYLVDQLNYLSIELLDHLGNPNPSQMEIDLMESILSNMTLSSSIFFHQRLNKNEIACLLLAAHGKSSKETAFLLNTSSLKVLSWRKEIKRKLNCKSMSQAVFQGIKYGYIPPQV